jgi:hypothetical protein
MLNSITKITKQYTTRGSSPVLVLANDSKNYVCKYQMAPSANYSGLLVNEFVASKMLKFWEIESPEIAIVNVKPEHVNMEDLRLQLNWFKIPCFGSLHSNFYREVDSFLSESSRYQSQAMNYDNLFLKIALFDLWTSNEDRHHGNYNLMLDTTQNNKLIPIDHANIFNTNTLNHAPYVISWDESLISSPLLLAIYRTKQLTDQKLLNNIKAYYYLCVQNCENNLPSILQKLPTEWCNDKNGLYTKIDKKLFNKDWIEHVWQSFLEYLQISINKTK